MGKASAVWMSPVNMSASHLFPTVNVEAQAVDRKFIPLFLALKEKKMRRENCFPRTWVKRFMRHYAVHLEIHFVPPNTVCPWK